jgi:hypothetical protein
MKKSQNIPVWLIKMVLARHFATVRFAEEAGREKECCCNNYDLTAAPYF